ncbi:MULTISPECIES: hypothetical protein [Streptomyces]|uniref:hypothetical protein n=1 Tax=Streptomyces TaxID=1883 RepID=UPI0033D14B21
MAGDHRVRAGGDLSDPRLAAELQAATGAGAPGITAQIAELERRRNTKAAQLEELADDPDLDPVLAMHAVASFDRKITALRAQLDATAEQRRLQKFLGITREAWMVQPMDIRAAVVKDLYRVIILPTSRRGPGFDPSTVQLKRRRQDSPGREGAPGEVHCRG